MTITFNVKPTGIAKGIGEEGLYFIPISASGINEKAASYYPVRDNFGRTPMKEIEGVCVHNGGAILICTGTYVLPCDDDGPDFDGARINNPLVEFLRRENPAVLLHDELRERLQTEQKRADKAEKENVELRRTIAAIRRAYREGMKAIENSPEET